MNFEKIALHVPTILLPKTGTDLTKYAVVACDQYTSQPDYWETVAGLTEGATSTLELILPEAYLESDNLESRILSINKNMQRYLDEGRLGGQKPGFVLVDRKTSQVPSRKGLVLALDLEHYDYSDGSQSLIRATEGTILDRLPPRIKVREQAPIELPHIMVLIDDPKKTVIEPLFEEDLEKLYDVELMMNGGHIQGYRVERADLIERVAAQLAGLADLDNFNKKYAVSDQGVLLYAMGDGNHSFATAKSIWQQLKAAAADKQAVMEHPARYALVELVNLHDEGLVFEPIHRVVFNIDPAHLLDKMASFYHAQGSTFSQRSFESAAAVQRAAAQPCPGDTHQFAFVTANDFGLATIAAPKLTLETATLQSFLDDYVKETPGAVTDYIHGDDVVGKLGSQPGNMGFYLPAISKHDFFKTIIRDGALPRKTFSMGEADEKRYYLECRKIVA